jgi:hypothetical protein
VGLESARRTPDGFPTRICYLFLGRLFRPRKIKNFWPWRSIKSVRRFAFLFLGRMARFRTWKFASGAPDKDF